jgi:hypothetical protein
MAYRSHLRSVVLPFVNNASPEGCNDSGEIVTSWHRQDSGCPIPRTLTYALEQLVGDRIGGAGGQPAFEQG